MLKYFAIALASVVSAKTSLQDLEGDTVSITPAAQTNILAGDFITGFESGIFLRENLDEIEKYNCPKAEVHMEDFKKVKEMMPAVVTMADVMMKDQPEMKNMLKSLNIFIDHMDQLIGVFDPLYEGGDFCAGLTFGVSGSNLLYQVASTIIHANLKNLKKNSRD